MKFYLISEWYKCLKQIGSIPGRYSSPWFRRWWIVIGDNLWLFLHTDLLNNMKIILDSCLLEDQAAAIFSLCPIAANLLKVSHAFFISHLNYHCLWRSQLQFFHNVLAQITDPIKFSHYMSCTGIAVVASNFWMHAFEISFLLKTWMFVKLMDTCKTAFFE